MISLLVTSTSLSDSLANAVGSNEFCRQINGITTSAKQNFIDMRDGQSSRRESSVGTTTHYRSTLQLPGARQCSIVHSFDPDSRFESLRNQYTFHCTWDVARRAEIERQVYEFAENINRCGGQGVRNDQDDDGIIATVQIGSTRFSVMSRHSRSQIALIVRERRPLR